MNKSRVVKKEQCPSCAKKGNDNSKDNLIVYEDGGKHCFACRYTILSETYKEENNIEEVQITNERRFYSRLLC